ncbi:hypothetical protein LINGRAHAP2_LOCUS11424 [Linum grandiflorum]
MDPDPTFPAAGTGIISDVPVIPGVNQTSGAFVPTIPAVDATHPYYITVGDHPSLVIVFVALTGEANYHSWSRSMKMSLLSKNTFSFIDPPFSLKRWANVLVLGWLHKSLSLDIAQSIL